jgi:acetyl-CoA carboxylase biotin carboxyl carrier protein
MELTEDDVLEILKLFEQSTFDFLQLEQGERKITVSKRGAVPTTTSAATVPAAPVPATASPLAAAPQAAVKAAPANPADAGLVPVMAPMVGKFYSAPSPQDSPYVTEGSKVAAGATLGLIEVMKVFTSIKTETAGTIERILITSGEFVEFGQPLFMLRPDA